MDLEAGRRKEKVAQAVKVLVLAVESLGGATQTSEQQAIDRNGWKLAKSNVQKGKKRVTLGWVGMSSGY